MPGGHCGLWDTALIFSIPASFCSPGRLPHLTCQTPSIACSLTWPRFSWKATYEGDLILFSRFQTSLEACWHSTKAPKPASSPNRLVSSVISPFIQPSCLCCHHPTQLWASFTFGTVCLWPSCPVSFPGLCRAGAPPAYPVTCPLLVSMPLIKPAQVRTQVAFPILYKVKGRKDQIPTQPVWWHFPAQDQFTREKQSKVLIRSQKLKACVTPSQDTYPLKKKKHYLKLFHLPF